MDAMDYELFVRSAFGYKTGEMPGRGGDPARIAEADWFRHDDIAKVKIGAGYAIEIYAGDVLNNCEVDDREWNRIEGFTTRVLESDSVGDIATIIDEFKTTVLDQYYTTGEGGRKLKS